MFLMLPKYSEMHCLGTTAGGIKEQKGAVFIRVKTLKSDSEMLSHNTLRISLHSRKVLKSRLI